MSIRNAMINGGESDSSTTEAAFVSGSSIHSTSWNATAGNRGGARGFSPQTGNFQSTGRFKVNSKGDTNIPWEEFLIEHRVTLGASTASRGNLAWQNGETMVGNVYVETNGQISHRVGGSNESLTTGTVQDSSAVDAINRDQAAFTYWAVHVLIDATVGLIKSWLDNLSAPVLSSTGIDTRGNSQTEVNGTIKCTARNALYYDDVVIRPRCILVDNNGGGAITGTPTLNSTCTGATGSETFEVYGWQTDSSDSESGTGDPDLPADTFRLFIKKVSFGPEDSSPTGFVDNEEITVPGLTGGGAGGNVFAHVPHSGYKAGLEPGGQFVGAGIWVERLTINATGTNNTDGSLGGGATDRADALDDLDDGLYMDHSAAAERVTCNIAALGDQAEIAEIVGVSVVVAALNAGGAPDAITPALLDNGTDLDGDKHALTTGNDAYSTKFDTNAAGGQITKGAGAGGLDSMEIGYLTGTA